MPAKRKNTSLSHQVAQKRKGNTQGGGDVQPVNLEDAGTRGVTGGVVQPVNQEGAGTSGLSGVQAAIPLPSQNHQVRYPEIWIVGDSLVRGAHQQSLFRPEGPNLGLDSLGYRIIWEYISGMKISELRETIEYLLNFHAPPVMLIIHCGGNDLGLISTLELTWSLKHFLQDYIKNALRNTKIVWSQILPRRTWRYIYDNLIAKRMCTRINSCLGKYFIKCGGAYIKYPDITCESTYFSADDCHLSNLGYNVMVSILSGAVCSFLFAGQAVFPYLS
ncbi:uncharacterized protein LOC128556072 [Mercenaria mercenaria]|uniref:uncharacterized protein LOC128556072 n=1 Tax=Mercenaria mercenaria TaxID=6596 RepID=UPI00234E8110|nr:uncharacterized protein LOC128556072 [Mercenaria mercenaria]